LRIQILKVLQQNAYGVLELCQIFDIRQSAMSHHLKILSNAGLVSSRREGTTIFYRRNPLNPDIDLQTMQKALFQAIDKALSTQMLLSGLQISIENAPALQWSFLIEMCLCLKKIRILLPAGQTMAIVLKAC
jgi:ArsR family transcriptional regulator